MQQKKNSKVKFCLRCNHLKECYLGYLMIFCVQNIKNVLINISGVKLKKILSECYSEIAIGSNKKIKNLLLQLRQLKTQTFHQIVEQGQKHIFSAFNASQTDGNFEQYTMDQLTEFMFIVGSALSLIANQHKNATIFYV